MSSIRTTISVALVGTAALLVLSSLGGTQVPFGQPPDHLGCIDGFVFIFSQRDTSGAQIDLYESSDPRWKTLVAKTKADSTGRFCFPKLAAGLYDLVVAVPVRPLNKFEHITNVQVDDGRVSEVEFRVMNDLYRRDNFPKWVPVFRTGGDSCGY
jgi:hypothetical protein